MGRIWYHNRFRHGNASYPVFTVDALFANRMLALAHWDVEGDELAVLRGADATLRRDRPSFTVETHAKRYAADHTAVMEQVRALNYIPFTLSARCGWSDCRNHVSVPSHLASTAARVLERALATDSSNGAAAKRKGAEPVVGTT